VAHIATAIFIATGMLAASGVRLVVQDQHTVNIVLWMAIAAPSMPLLISLVQQLSKGNFSVDILALLSIVTSFLGSTGWLRLLC
jgi:hypothetical protein